MPSLSRRHIVCLQRNGAAFANHLVPPLSLDVAAPDVHERFKDCISIPPLDAGMRYTHVAAGGNNYTLLLRSDGKVIAAGSPGDGQTGVATGKRNWEIGNGQGRSSSASLSGSTTTSSIDDQ